MIKNIISEGIVSKLFAFILISKIQKSHDLQMIYDDKLIILVNVMRQIHEGEQ